MKYKLAYCSFLESASNAISVGIYKNEKQQQNIKPNILLHTNNFVKHE